MSNPSSFSIRSDLSISDTNVNGDLQVQGDSTYYGLVDLVSASTNLPCLEIINRNNNASSGKVQFLKSPIDDVLSADDSLGKINFNGLTLSTGTGAAQYSRIESFARDPTNNNEDGSTMIRCMVGGTDTIVTRTNPAAGTGGLYTAGSAGAGGLGFTKPVIDITSTTFTLDANQSGSTVLLNNALGIAVTLPPAAVGIHYDFLVTTTAAGGGGASYVLDGTAGEDFFGAVTLYTEAGASFGHFVKTGGASVNLVATNGGGSSTGSVAGGSLSCTCVGTGAGDDWQIQGNAVTTIAFNAAGPWM